MKKMRMLGMKIENEDIISLLTMFLEEGKEWDRKQEIQERLRKNKGVQTKVSDWFTVTKIERKKEVEAKKTVTRKYKQTTLWQGIEVKKQGQGSDIEVTDDDLKEGLTTISPSKHSLDEVEDDPPEQTVLTEVGRMIGCTRLGPGEPGKASCPQGGWGTHDHWKGGTQGGGGSLDTLPPVPPGTRRGETHQNSKVETIWGDKVVQGEARSKTGKSPSISPGIMRMRKLFEKVEESVDSHLTVKEESKVRQVIDSFEILM